LPHKGFSHTLKAKFTTIAPFREKSLQAKSAISDGYFLIFNPWYDFAKADVASPAAGAPPHRGPQINV